MDHLYNIYFKQRLIRESTIGSFNISQVFCFSLSQVHVFLKHWGKAKKVTRVFFCYKKCFYGFPQKWDYIVITFSSLRAVAFVLKFQMGGEYQIWTSQPTTPIRAEMKKKPEQFVIFLAFVFCRTFRWKMLKSDIWTGVLAAVVAVAVAFVVVMLKRFMEQRICLNKWTKRQRQASLDGTNSGKS